MPAARALLIPVLLVLTAPPAHALGAGGPAAMAHDGTAMRETGRAGIAAPAPRIAPAPRRRPR
ncbi:hypothetical protein ASG52_06810 [Methylobacterium sp. Leaf456]|uniref:hypothetical protein n=1 Tax=Methylobacterium sp. Leaf456 TaxID=1736382 RepID=UPI0006F1C632|nr:hypothetical protein [Methylobacterium sp. Leaf456]KQT50520.1 hypothetical protein ASG52_06810 [Methylobacterium sp. Leaf456]